MSMPRALPAGTVTFLFTDVEGSTRLLERLGSAYAGALLEHRRVLRDVVAAEGGVVVDAQGDAFFVVFRRASGAAAAALAAQTALASGPIRVRMGLHTGEPQVTNEGYVGIDVHRGARIAAAGHGGQILVSEQTQKLLGDRADMRDLGLHRLKDMGAPEHIFQLGEGEFATLKSLRQSNLPIQVTPFVGREAALADVVALVRRDGVRLVTLLGPGGTGKTRLGLAAAAELAEDFTEGGVWFAGLGALTDSRMVMPTLARALDARGAADESALDALIRHVRSRATLIVVDNLEQLLPDAAQPLASLLAACPHSKLLVTSREPLHVAAEREFPVLPFSRDEAVSFFAERAQAVRPGFVLDSDARAAVEAICARLDGLPLALELAAARIKLLPPQALLARVEQRLPLLTGGSRDAPERQRTLRATIAWSHDLLAAEEQRAFARLAVFSAGTTLETAEDVCGATLDVLAALIDKSLVVYGDSGAGSARYSMLETIREYALERLEASGEEALWRERQAGWAASLAEDLERRIAREDATSLASLRAEVHNLRTALAWARGAGRHDLIARIVGALGMFWLAEVRPREAKEWVDDALAADLADPVLRAKVLGAATIVHLYLGDLDAADRCSAERLALCLEPDAQRAGALHSRAWLEGSSGRLERAVELGIEAAAIARQTGETWRLRQTLSNLGYEELRRGNIASARAYLEEAIDLRHGTWAGQAGRLGALSNLALIGAVEDDPETVRHATRELAQRFSELDAARDPPILDGFLIGVGWLGARGGDAALALQAYATALEHREATGYTMDDDSPEALAERATRQFLDAASLGRLAECREHIRRGGQGPALNALIAQLLAD